MSMKLLPGKMYQLRSRVWAYPKTDASGNLKGDAVYTSLSPSARITAIVQYAKGKRGGIDKTRALVQLSDLRAPVLWAWINADQAEEIGRNPAKKRGRSYAEMMDSAHRGNDPASLTASQINRMLVTLGKRDSALTSEMIAAGRGDEKPSETRKRGDPLSAAICEIWDRQAALRAEIARRYGPGAPARLPTRRRNPAKKSPRRVSQITGKPPSKRLQARRAKKHVPGYFPNPVDFVSVPMMDAADPNELNEFLSFIGNGKRPSAAAAARLLFPSHKTGGVAAVAKLRVAAWNALAAQRCRLSGDIQAALKYEKIVDKIYNELPHWARWDKENPAPRSPQHFYWFKADGSVSRAFVTKRAAESQARIYAKNSGKTVALIRGTQREYLDIVAPESRAARYDA